MRRETDNGWEREREREREREIEREKEAEEEEIDEGSYRNRPKLRQGKYR